MKTRVYVCQGISCKARGSDSLYYVACDTAEGHEDKIEVTRCNCTGNCSNGPTAVEEVGIKNTIHSFMNTEKIINLIKKILHATE